MWKRFLWPEGIVLFFNTVLNKSHEWGTQPFYWYFTSAVPRMLLSSAIFVPIGMLSSNSISSFLSYLPFAKQLRNNSGKDYNNCLGFDKEILQLIVPVLIFITTYSILPHKEMRFILCTVPILNVVAAVGFAKLYRNISVSVVPYVVGLTVVVLGVVCCVIFLTASRLNYPGGMALRMIHEAVDETKMLLSTASHSSIKLHIDNLAAQTGVSRFGELHSKSMWTYSKREFTSYNREYYSAFTHLITENATRHSLEFQLIGDPIHSFDRLLIGLHFPKVRTRKTLYLMERNNFSKKTVSYSEDDEQCDDVTLQ